MHFRAFKLDEFYKDGKKFFPVKDPSYRSLKTYNDCMHTCMRTYYNCNSAVTSWNQYGIHFSFYFCVGCTCAAAAAR